MTTPLRTSRAGHRSGQQPAQLRLIDTSTIPPSPPSTRYQGSKLKLLPWIRENIADLKFTTALDAFGGTASVSYMLKAQQKAVTYNDYLQFNHLIGKVLIENHGMQLADGEVAFILARHADIQYQDFIASTFRGIYFEEDENTWLDTVVQNIPLLEDPYKRAIAYYALFQSCAIKRPYNLFHRQNLYMRTAHVDRGFGNKTTWDRPFEQHFRSFVVEANEAAFDSGVPCLSVCHDAREVPGEYDLVYIDTPYISKKGVGVDYLDFYHFLEGLIDYPRWPDRINYRKKHRPLLGDRSPWSDQRYTHDAFRQLFERHSRSILVVSYRSDGIPTEAALIEMMREVKSSVNVLHYGGYKYVLSTNGSSKELLLIGT